MKHFYFNRKTEWAIATLTFLLLIGTTVWQKRINTRKHAASVGYSPLEWLATRNHPEAFARDYPSGIEIFSTSFGP